MTVPRPVELRAAQPEDAERIARLHAASWRRHYRGAYSGSYLDGEIVAERSTVWSSRLTEPGAARTIVAEDAFGLLGFVHVVVDDDDRWGSLIDNLHVTYERQRSGIGTLLLARAATQVVERATGRALYLWVQEQNVAAQRFYRLRGGRVSEIAAISPPGGVASRLVGSPRKLRISWPDAATLTSAEAG